MSPILGSVELPSRRGADCVCLPRRGLDDGKTTMRKRSGQPSSDDRQITEREADKIEERSSPRTPVIYEIVRRLGEEEMARPITSLWWSGRRRAVDQFFAIGPGYSANAFA